MINLIIGIIAGAAAEWKFQFVGKAIVFVKGLLQKKSK